MKGVSAAVTVGGGGGAGAAAVMAGVPMAGAWGGPAPACGPCCRRRGESRRMDAFEDRIVCVLSAAAVDPGSRAASIDDDVVVLRLTLLSPPHLRSELLLSRRNRPRCAHGVGWDLDLDLLARLLLLPPLGGAVVPVVLRGMLPSGSLHVWQLPPAKAGNGRCRCPA